MTVKECYAAMSGNYDEVVSRLRDDARIAKFLCRVPSDPSYDLLIGSIASNNAEEAFRAAHTIKGICLNLSITQLYRSSHALTEALRGKTEIPPEAAALAEQVKTDYQLVVDCIKQIQ